MRKQQNREIAIETIRAAAHKWPSTFVARSKVNEFTGGMIAAGTLANRDSDGTGVEGAFKIGKIMCYPVDKLCDWLISRLEKGDN